MVKGTKVDTEQFYDLKREIDGVNHRCNSIDKRIDTLEKNLEGKIDLLKYGILVLIGIGLLKSCGEGNTQKQSYVQPQPQVYVINVDDYNKKQLEVLKDISKKLEAYKEGEKK